MGSRQRVDGYLPRFFQQENKVLQVEWRDQRPALYAPHCHYFAGCRLTLGTVWLTVALKSPRLLKADAAETALKFGFFDFRDLIAL